MKKNLRSRNLKKHDHTTPISESLEVWGMLEGTPTIEGFFKEIPHIFPQPKCPVLSLKWALLGSYFKGSAAVFQRFLRHVAFGAEIS